MWSSRQMSVAESGDPQGEAVIVLGGLGPNINDMGRLRESLASAGYRVIDIDYPSTHYSIQTLAQEHIGPAIVSAQINPAKPVHFVTLSMGGIVARAYLKSNPLPNLGRVVMLAPPNHGSEIVDWLKNWSFFRWRFGPAGLELATAPDSVPNQLGPAHYEVGVIAGNRHCDPWFAWMFNGPHDGKVSVQSARLDGMTDFAVVPSTHYTIMKHPQTLALTKRFLRTGNFNGDIEHE